MHLTGAVLVVARRCRRRRAAEARECIVYVCVCVCYCEASCSIMRLQPDARKNRVVLCKTRTTTQHATRRTTHEIRLRPGRVFYVRVSGAQCHNDASLITHTHTLHTTTSTPSIHFVYNIITQRTPKYDPPQAPGSATTRRVSYIMLTYANFG